MVGGSSVDAFPSKFVKLGSYLYFYVLVCQREECRATVFVKSRHFPSVVTLLCKLAHQLFYCS